MEVILEKFAIYALPVILAITLHEAAHAYAAKYFGDDTAQMLGRMSLNPIRHIDIFGTILIPSVLFISGSPFIFGYAKPVPVNFGRLRKPKRDMAWVALAGPAANLFMALCWMLLSILLSKLNFYSPFVFKMMQAGLVVNLVLFAFNLFPIPPLDGGRILVGVLPYRYAQKVSSIEQYGFFIVLGLAFMQVLHYWMRPVMYAAGTLLQFIISPLT